MSANGSRPPDGGEKPPLRQRLRSGNLPCAAVGCTGLILFLVILLVALSHPFVVIVAGIVIMAVFGGAMLIWRD